MATIAQSLALHDGFTPVLNNISSAMSSTIKIFDKMQSVIDRDVNLDITMRNDIISEVDHLVDKLEKMSSVNLDVTGDMDQIVLPINNLDEVTSQLNVIEEQQRVISQQAQSTEVLSSMDGVDKINSQLTAVEEKQQALSRKGQNTHVIAKESTQEINRTSSMISRLTAKIQSVERSVDLTTYAQKNFNTQVDKSVSVVRKLDGMMKGLKGGVGGVVDKIKESIRKQTQFTNETNNSRNSMNRLGRSVLILNQGLELAQKVMSSISSLAEGADARSSVDARLKLINDGLRTQAELEADVMKAANESRTSYEALGAVVAKMGRQDYFAGDNKAAIAFADTISKALIISGADTSEANAALLQLSQGIASGVLRGDEFNSIMENGSELGAALARSLGVTKGELRSMAEEGMLTTDVVVQGIMKQADAINSEFKSMPMQFGQATTILKNKWSEVLDTLNQPGQGVHNLIQQVITLSEWLGTPQGMALIDGITNGINKAIEGVIWFGNVAASVYQVFERNWSWIGPLLIGGAVGVGILSAAFLVYKAIMIGAAMWTGIQAAATLVQALATGAATSAQWGLNAAFWACPITWIVAGILLIIAVVVGLVLWVRRMCQENDEWARNVSVAVGTAIGLFYALGAHVGNAFILLHNIIGPFATFVENVFKSPVAAVQTLLLDLSLSVVGYIRNMASALEGLINMIPGVEMDLTSGIDGFIDKIEGVKATIETENNLEKFEPKDYIEYKDSFMKGFNKGKDKTTEWIDRPQDKTSKKEEQVKRMDKSNFTQMPDINKVESVGKIDKEVEVKSEDLEIMRDLAEIQSIQNFVTLQPKVEITTGDIREEVDLDKLVRQIDEKLMEEMEASTKEVYDVG